MLLPPHDLFATLALAPAITLTPPTPAPPPPRPPAVVLPASACRPSPPFPPSILAKLTPEELAVLTARADINAKARHAIKAACSGKLPVVRLKPPKRSR